MVNLGVDPGAGMNTRVNEVRNVLWGPHGVGALTGPLQPQCTFTSGRSDVILAALALTGMTQRFENSTGSITPFSVPFYKPVGAFAFCCAGTIAEDHRLNVLVAEVIEETGRAFGG